MHFGSGDDGIWDRYRDYLRMLAQAKVNLVFRARMDASDVVQQTLLHAYQERDRFDGQSEGEWLVWLQRILDQQLVQMIRRHRARKRDVAKEQSMEARLQESSGRLEKILSARESSPSARVERHELYLRAAQALDQLSPDQQTAVTLHYLVGCKLGETADLMETTKGAVAGYLQRGVKKLREILKEPSEDDDDQPIS